MLNVVTFIKETFQLPYYVYFRPSALQVRLNGIVLQKEQEANFRHITGGIGRNAYARRFLLQCWIWWLLGLLPFWYLAQGVILEQGILLITVGLLLAAWSVTMLAGLPLGLAFPVLSGLIWGLKPELWTALQVSLNDQDLKWMAITLILGITLAGGAITWALTSQRKWLTSLLTGIVGSAMFVILTFVVTIASGIRPIVAVVGIIAVNIAVGTLASSAKKDNTVAAAALITIAVAASVVALSTASR